MLRFRSSLAFAAAYATCAILALPVAVKDGPAFGISWYIGPDCNHDDLRSFWSGPLAPDICLPIVNSATWTHQFRSFRLRLDNTETKYSVLVNTDQWNCAANSITIPASEIVLGPNGCNYVSAPLDGEEWKSFSFAPA
ncbi:hypothetical protein FA15DRAFT_727621 [Coprinopsis marcescibilis]|uniref:Uncharacterized protein n=1 Tax=Coprinopsis marcescibilis TaxID=230819 RepID=A0A5C3L3D9_COPMA|nr:hypothetical protein FA15DRAFT_727621 [Coprinopsis marcescibilis]